MAAILPLLTVLLAVPVRAQDWGTGQTVARVSYLSGDVSYSRGDDPDDWQAPVRNVPLTLGDRVYAGENGRAELQVHGGQIIRIAPGTDLAVLNLTDDVKQFSLSAGTASFQVRRLSEDETFEVDTPNVAVTFERPGDYRIDVDESGNTRVIAGSGEAVVAAAGGEVPLRAREQMWIDGIDNPQYDVAEMGDGDSWDRWVAFRESRSNRPSSLRYVNAGIVGVEDLDQFGRWVDVPGYGECWTPATVEFGWQPYRFGRWFWEDPWGWTWIADEPWGWAPYHYGRWVVYSSRWYWVPVGPSVRFVDYSPALVAFVGGGPGWSLSLQFGGGGYVGWFPLAPRDPFVPWWNTRSRVDVNVTNVTYVNRTYVTVVNQNTFVSGGAVSAAVVRDPGVVRQIAAAPVIRGPVPAIPTARAIRASVAAAPAPRPPAVIATRPVVTRVAPPPAPAPFRAKLDVIRQNRGAPVAPSTAAQLSITAQSGARAVAPVRPAAAENGRIELRPRNAQAAAERPAPLTARRGKPLATMERPIVSTPTAASSPRGEAPARIAPGAVVRPRDVPIAPPPTEAAPRRQFERRNIPQEPSETPAPPSEGWRNRPSPPPPAPPGNEEPRRFQRPPQPPPEEAPPPAERPRGVERQFTPPPAEATPPPPPPEERRIGRPFTPPPEPAQPPPPEERRIGRPLTPSGEQAPPQEPRRVEGERGQSGSAAPPPERGGKNVPQRGKKAPDKNKGKKKPPPPPPPPPPASSGF